MHVHTMLQHTATENRSTPFYTDDIIYEKNAGSSDIIQVSRILSRVKGTGPLTYPKRLLFISHHHNVSTSLLF